MSTDATTSGRTDRTAAAADLLARADREGLVDLTVLSDDEECVLGDGRWALSDAATWERWCALDGPERDARARAALGGLVARGLAVPSPGGDGLVPDAALGFVQAARSRPGFLVTGLAAGPDDRPRPAPLAYGVVEDARRVRAVVLELRDDDAHDYRLLSPARAAGALTRWAAQALVPDEDGVASPVVVLEVLRHRVGEELEAAAVTLAVPAPHDPVLGDPAPHDPVLGDPAPHDPVLGDPAPTGSTLFFGGRRERHDPADPGTAERHLQELFEQAADVAGPVGAGPGD